MAESADQAQIRSLIVDWAAAVRAQDMTGILRHHAADMIMFDVPPPMQLLGIKAYEDSWPQFFDASPKPVKFDIVDLQITAGTDVAFAVALMRCVVDLDFRLTIGLRKIEGQWTVVHEHHSVPATS